MRDFYDRQDHAHEETFYLVGLLIFGSIIVVATTAVAMAAAVTGLCYANYKRTTTWELPEAWVQEHFLLFLAASTVISIAIVVGSMLRRMWQISETGGRGIAESLGGQRVLDLDATGEQRTLLNVIEELAIASGIKRPALYVLDDPAINGFAAGKDEKDAIVAVTTGAMQRLNREQMQGVMAHEFSHIIKNDIALNTRLIGTLAGLRALGNTADWCLGMRATGSGSAVASNPMGGAMLACIGAAIYPVGKIGQFFAAMIVSAVNRQREFLADAHAVELTRNPSGLREALEIIATTGVPSRALGGDETSHLFFADTTGLSRWLFATHPPLKERISRLNDGAVPPMPEPVEQQPAEHEMATSS